MKYKGLTPQTKTDMDDLVKLFIRTHERVEQCQINLDKAVAALFKKACAASADDFALLQDIANAIESRLDMFPELQEGKVRSVTLKNGTIHVRKTASLEVPDESALLDELDSIASNASLPKSVRIAARVCIAVKRSPKKKELGASNELLEYLTTAERNEYDSISISPPGAKKKLSTTAAPLKINLVK